MCAVTKRRASQPAAGLLAAVAALAEEAAIFGVLDSSASVESFAFLRLLRDSQGSWGLVILGSLPPLQCLIVLSE